MSQSLSCRDSLDAAASGETLHPLVTSPSPLNLKSALYHPGLLDLVLSHRRPSPWNLWGSAGAWREVGGTIITQPSALFPTKFVPQIQP